MKPQAFFLPACAVASLLIVFATPQADAQPTDPSNKEQLETQVAHIFEESCAQAGCHAGPNPQQGMRLTKDQFYGHTVGVPSRERPDLMRIAPGDPDSSYLIQKVKGAPNIEGAQMPLIGEKLSQEQIRTIEAWTERLDEVDEGRKQREQAAEATVAQPFSGWKVINVPTTRMVGANRWLFLIGHRFNPPVNAGYDALFGLDGSGIIFLSLGYALTDDLLISLGRSNASDDVELEGKYRLTRQTQTWPIAVALRGAVNWISEANSEGRYRSEAFKYTGQLVLTRAQEGRLGLSITPGLLVNPAEGKEGESSMITIGLGGRWRFYRNLSFVGEWVPIVSGFTRTTTFGNANRFDSWGAGFEISTGGHVFQIVVSNSVGITTDQYFRGGDLDLRDGRVRLGFNIFRILDF